MQLGENADGTIVAVVIAKTGVVSSIRAGRVRLICRWRAMRLMGSPLGTLEYDQALAGRWFRRRPHIFDRRLLPGFW